jgi:hypothetical protein
MNIKRPLFKRAFLFYEVFGMRSNQRGLVAAIPLFQS